MENQATEVIYVVDTSSLVNVQRTYPQAVFLGVWQQMSELARAGRLISAREVLNELERGGDDEIYKWAKDNRFMFQDPDGEQIEVAREIVNTPEFHRLFDIESETPDADPFVIALATVEQRRSTLFPQRYVVVADEAKAQPGRKPRIPDVCNQQRYQLECINILEMFRREAWEFVRRPEGAAP